MPLGRLPFVLFALLAILAIAGNASGMLSLDVLAFVLFVLLIASVVYWDRRKVKIEGIVIIRRTQKGKEIIDRIAQRYPRFWHVWGKLGVIICIPVMVLGTYYLLTLAWGIVSGGAGGIALVLPGPVSAPIAVPGLFVVPWWVWFICIPIIVIPHEFMHGIMCRADKVKIKSVGWALFLFVIPAAFVEPDERHMKKTSRLTRMKVYAAGSFINLAMALAVVLVLIALFPILFHPAGVLVGAINGTPANQSGLVGTLTMLDGQQVRDLSDIVTILGAHRPGDQISVSYSPDIALAVPRFGITHILSPTQAAAVEFTEVRQMTVTLADHPDQAGKAYLGILPQAPAFTYQPAALIGYALLGYLFVFLLGIGLVNMLPMKPLDGGLLFEEIVAHYTPRTKRIVRAVSYFIFFLILFNLLGPVFL